MRRIWVFSSTTSTSSRLSICKSSTHHLAMTWGLRIVLFAQALIFTGGGHVLQGELFGYPGTGTGCILVVRPLFTRRGMCQPSRPQSVVGFVKEGVSMQLL